MTYNNLFKLLHLGKYERHLPLIGVWRNWLAHLPDTEGVSGSNPDTPTNYFYMYKILLCLLLAFTTNYGYSQLKYNQIDIEIGLSSSIDEPHINMLYVGGTIYNAYLEFQTNAFTKGMGYNNIIDMKAINVGAAFPMYQTNKFSYIITPKIGIWTTNPNTYFCGGLNFSVVYKFIRISLLTTFVRSEQFIGIGLGVSL